LPVVVYKRATKVKMSSVGSIIICRRGQKPFTYLFNSINPAFAAALLCFGFVIVVVVD